MFLARVLGTLYIINNVNNDDLRTRASFQLLASSIAFVVLFVVYLVHLLLKDGYAYDDGGLIVVEPYKYLHNFLDMWYLLVMLVIGVVLVLFAISRSFMDKKFIWGIWPAGIGVVMVVLSLLLCAGWNHTAYYPSTADLQSSLTIQNSCSSEFTLTTMAIVSILIPFVLAYIWHAWWSIDQKKLDIQEINDDHAY